MRLRDNPEDLQALVATVSSRTGIPATQVEKDFWLTEALRGMTGDAATQHFTLLFKGGTSLSKAYHIIQRFSEGVDVLVVLPDAGAGARDRHLKALVAAAEGASGLPATVDPSKTSSKPTIAA